MENELKLINDKGVNRLIRLLGGIFDSDEINKQDAIDTWVTGMVLCRAAGIEKLTLFEVAPTALMAVYKQQEENDDEGQRSESEGPGEDSEGSS